MNLQTFLMRSPELAQSDSAHSFEAAWTPRDLAKGGFLMRQGEAAPHEYILLKGRLISQILDPEGRAICVGMYVGPCVVAPQMARSKDGISLVSIQAVTDVQTAQIAADALSNLMLDVPPIRDWANQVLRDELAHKADREWCLAALGGAERLLWFRERYPEYETLFTHATIASFLGITPVTFSRLRSGA